MENFESFSEDLIPRILPQPTLHPVLDMSKPTVPEVSLIFDDSKQFILNNETQPNSYKMWKQQQQQQQCQEPIAQQPTNRIQSSDRKKIVTFNLPAEGHTEMQKQPQTSESTPIARCQQLDLSLNEPTGSGSIRHSIPKNISPSELQYNPQDYNGYMPYQNNNTNGHKSIPMTNQLNNVGTPNQLKQHSNAQNFTNCAAPKEITLHEVYQLLQNMQINNSPNRKSHTFNQFDNAVGELDRNQQISHASGAPSGDPTARDIFNVILKQQEQLMNLQSQVQLLLMRTANTPMHQQNDSTQYANRIPHKRTHTNCNEIDARNQQMSVMTSLEINVQNGKSSAAKTPTVANAAAAATATDFITPKKSKRAAIMGNQSVKQCGCVCNCNEQNHIQSTDSGSDDDNFDKSPDHGETQTGWTFYGNILNQVNDVLQSTPPTASAKTNENDTPSIAANIENHYHNANNMPCKQYPHSMPKQIRTAQFKQVGFQIDDVNISAMSKRITFGSPSCEVPRNVPTQRIIPNDNSVLINALALKYLPCDLNGTPTSPAAPPPIPQITMQTSSSPMTPTNFRTSATDAIAQTTPSPTTTATTVNGFAMNRSNELDENKNLNTDMSITSYRYMEKYGLL